MATVEADRELKAKHRALWASGDYPAVAAELIPALGPELVRALGVKSGDRVLDVAAGSGNAAIPAAAVGAMFAPHHQSTADEVVRVVRPGGTIGMINWTPEGFIGNLFATMKPYAPPPPPGASPAPLWGDEDHVRRLFGDRVTDLTTRRQTVRMDHCANPTEFREYWKRNYGPTIAAYRFNKEQPERVEALDRDFLSLLTKWNQATEPGQTAYDAEYLLLVGTKR